MVFGNKFLVDSVDNLGTSRKNIQKMLKAIFCLISILIAQVHSHGLLIDPPNRSSLFRFLEDPFIKPYESIVEPNWTDNQLYCGGVQVQQQQNDGKCGLCGDAYNGVRENEAGGKYGKGIIVRKYDQGALMKVTVQLTAHHNGYFEFRLCEWNNPTVPGTFECLNQNLLQQANGNTKYYPNKNTSPWIYTYSLQLPSDLTCTQCILQWRYHAENTWNCDDAGNCCMGCGPQEEFYGCADIAIGEEVLPPPNWNQTPAATTTTLLTKITTQSKPSGNQDSSTPTTTTTTTTAATTTASNENTNSPDEISCVNRPQGEYMADCDTFYTCGSGGSGPFIYDCAPGTIYDEVRGICDFGYNVPPPCGSKSTFHH